MNSLPLALLAVTVFTLGIAWTARKRLSGVPTRTSRPVTPVVVWYQPVDWQVAHAFHLGDFTMGPPDVEALCHVDRWLKTELKINDHAQHCPACEQALTAGRPVP